jgi:hypothetical protein
MRLMAMAFALLAALPLLEGIAAAAPQCCADAQKEMQRSEFCGVKVIEDPPTSRKWLLSRNVEHPAWPARLIEMHGENKLLCPSPERIQSRHSPSGSAEAVVHARDSVVVVEDAPAWRGAIDGVALAGGRAGDLVPVRLRFSGKVVRVIVVSKGKAILAGRETEGTPWE